MGANNIEGDSSLDLGSIKAELKFREDKIKELHSKEVKLKQLLKKAKVIID